VSCETYYPPYWVAGARELPEAQRVLGTDRRAITRQGEVAVRWWATRDHCRPGTGGSGRSGRTSPHHPAAHPSVDVTGRRTGAVPGRSLATDSCHDLASVILRDLNQCTSSEET
jgi:hypothetical protein